MIPPSLDIHPSDFQWAQASVRSGRFTFVVSGNPELLPALSDGMAFVRKDIGIKWDVRRYGEFTVPVVTLAAFMRDTGVQKFGVVRFGANAEQILSHLPGPVSDTLEIDAELTEDTRNRLLQWYSPMANVWKLKERRP